MKKLTLFLFSAMLLFSGYASGQTNSKFDLNEDGKIDVADLEYLIKSMNTPGETRPYVDLGLTSGTLWATMNIGAESPEDTGDWFAWGETTGHNSGKSEFYWNTYKYCKGSNSTLTKYSHESSMGNFGYNGFVDEKLELEPEDDAASVNWGDSWRTPTIAQWKELKNECTSTWTTQNGVNGRIIVGPNGNSIFLPVTGYYAYTTYYSGNNYGYYWSRTLDTGYSYFVKMAYCNSNTLDTSTGNRYQGNAIRAVRAE